MAESDFDEALRNKLSGLEAPVDDAAWTRIEENLPPAGGGGRAVVWLLLLLLLGIGGYYLAGYVHTPASDSEEGPMVSQQQPPSSGSRDKSLADPSVQDTDLFAESDVAASQLAESTYSQIEIGEKSPADDLLSVPGRPRTRQMSGSMLAGSSDATQDQGKSILAGPSGNLNSLSISGAATFPFDGHVSRRVVGLNSIKDSGKGTVLPRKGSRRSLLGLYVSPNASYHRFLPDTNDNIMLTALESGPMESRMTIDASLMYQRYAGLRWAWYLYGGYMMNRHQFTYTYTITGADATVQQNGDSFVLSAVEESRQETVNMTRHSFGLGGGAWYIIDRDKFREHSIGVGAGYYYSLGGRPSRVIGDISYQWSLRWLSGAAGRSEWHVDIGPVFRYELSPPQEIATGLNVRSYFIGVRAGLRLGL